MGKKWYEVVIGIDKRGRIWVCIPFRWEHKPYRPKRLVSLDINLKKIVIYNGRGIRRINTGFTEALYLNILLKGFRNVIVMLGDVIGNG